MKLYRFMGIDELNSLRAREEIYGRGTLGRNKVCFFPESVESWPYNENHSTTEITFIPSEEMSETLINITNDRIRVEFEIPNEKFEEMINSGKISYEEATYGQVPGVYSEDGRTNVLELQADSYSLNDYNISNIFLVSEFSMQKQFKIDLDNSRHFDILKEVAEPGVTYIDSENKVTFTKGPRHITPENINITTDFCVRLELNTTPQRPFNKDFLESIEPYTSSYSSEKFKIIESENNPNDIGSKIRWKIRSDSIPYDLYERYFGNIDGLSRLATGEFSKKIIEDFYEKQLRVSLPKEVNELLNASVTTIEENCSIPKIDNKYIIYTDSTICVQVSYEITEGSIWRIKDSEGTHFCTNKELLERLPTMGNEIFSISKNDNPTLEKESLTGFLHDCKDFSQNSIDKSKIENGYYNYEKIKEYIISDIAKQIGCPGEDHRISFFTHRFRLPPDEDFSKGLNWADTYIIYEKPFLSENSFKIGFNQNTFTIFDGEETLRKILNEYTESKESQQEIIRTLCTTDPLAKETKEDFCNRCVNIALDKEKEFDIMDLVAKMDEEQPSQSHSIELSSCEI